LYILGFDIGGTKCAVITAEWDGQEIKLLKKDKCATDHTIGAYEMIDKMIAMADGILDKKPDKIGISCGGPLDSKKGIIMCPPNLPKWDNIEIVKKLEDYYGVSAYLQNDANACALAEWKFGAGKGFENMVFLTFGTGMGAGLILNGKLYEGTNGNAGEVGHIRMAQSGPIGYGKAGSFEGFCSGGGIARLGVQLAHERIANGEYPLYLQKGMNVSDVTAKSIAEAAKRGDSVAKEVYRISGEYLGKGLSILIDILNPEAIVIGSIFERDGELLLKPMKEQIEKEALSISARVCKILPAKLGNSIGDLAAIAAIFM